MGESDEGGGMKTTRNIRVGDWVRTSMGIFEITKVKKDIIILDCNIYFYPNEILEVRKAKRGKK